MKYTEFPKEVLEKLQFYVYRLVDPRNGETFYVGKGRRNRVFSHLRDAESKLGSNSAILAHLDQEESKQSNTEIEASLKLQKIHDIHLDGLKVLIIIHRHGMTETVSFEVEAALIDAYPGLTNQVYGHGKSEVGIQSPEQILSEHAAVEFEVQDRLLAISVNISHGLERRELLDATRYAWILSKSNAKGRIVLAHRGGLVVGVFEVDKWLPADDEEFSEFHKKYGVPIKRWAFVGKEAPAEIRDNYLNKRVPARYRKRGAANPIRYIDPECDVCGNTRKVDFRSSGLGPTSYFICKNCERKGAEPLSTICFWLFNEGGLENLSPNVKWHFTEKVISFHEGQYIDAKEIEKLYPSHEKEFFASDIDDCVLVDDDL